MLPSIDPPVDHKGFDEGLSSYRRQDWDAAEAAFRSFVDANTNGSPAQVYLDRIAQLRIDSPPSDWNGVWVFETK